MHSPSDANSHPLYNQCHSKKKKQKEQLIILVMMDSLKKKSERLDDYVTLTDRHIEDNCFGLSHLYEE